MCGQLRKPMSKGVLSLDTLAQAHDQAAIHVPRWGVA